MLVIDTGIFVAVADRDEPHHSASVEALRGRNDFVVPAPVIPETAWLIEARLGPDAEARFHIATIDRRDFAVVRPRHCDAFELIP